MRTFATVMFAAFLMGTNAIKQDSVDQVDAETVAVVEEDYDFSELEAKISLWWSENMPKLEEVAEEQYDQVMSDLEEEFGVLLDVCEEGQACRNENNASTKELIRNEW